MPEFLQSIVDGVGQYGGPVAEMLVRVAIFGLAMGVGVAALLAIFYGFWIGLSGGLRQEERARCFLQLIETGLAQGRTVEETILSLARARIRDMGVYFHLVAGWMERGLRLGAALEEVPQFLPTQVASMLRVGEATGNLGGILAACRSSIRPGSSAARKQTNLLMVLFLVSPAGPAVAWILAIFVLPKFKALAMDLELPVSNSLETWFNASLLIGTVTAVVWTLFWVVQAGRGGGHWMFRNLFPVGNAWADACELRVPWKRKRLQRDFSTMLAALLEADIPEARAVQLAAEGTGNSRIIQRAATVKERLQQGVGLAEALSALDDSGEFAWRLRNAARSNRSFATALAGWNESLEARAFQQEQVFSQTISTGFVLLNGVMVGLASVGVFQFLISVVDNIAW